MGFRKVIFWLHLICGVITGIVVFIMSITGVALTYQKQMTSWANERLYRIEPQADEARLSAEALAGKFIEAMPATAFANLTIYSDPSKAATIATGPNEMFFLHPYTGEILGTGSKGMQTFFRVMTDWHRWLGFSGEGRKIGRAVTGACNLAFLFLVITGLYLWLPRKWTAQMLRPIAWFRRGLDGKGRDYNWHHVFGLWFAVPLAIIVASAVVISYPWANNLVYRLAGSQPPAPKSAPPKVKTGTPPGMAQMPLHLEGLNPLVQRACEQIKNWQSINFQLPRVGDKTVSFNIDTGSGIKPQLRSTIVLDRKTGEILRLQAFKDLDRGFRARIWLRFVHTGEYYGFWGQTIAGIASAAGVILVYTGIALSLRRYCAWLRRRAQI